MRVVVDGIIYGLQTYGGINTYFNAVLPTIAGLAGTAVDVLLPSACKGTPPGPPVRRLTRDLLPGRTGLSWSLDQRIQACVEPVNLGLRGLWAMGKRDVVFQSTYLTSLPVPVPQVAIVHDLNHEMFPDLYGDPFGLWLRRRYPRYVRRARRVIAVSQTTKAHLSTFYGLDPATIDVVYHATDPSVFFVERQDTLRSRLADEFDIRQPYILYVGVHSSGFKNFATLLDTFSSLARHTPWTLVVAGPPWDQSERERLAKLPAQAQVRLIPHPPDPVLRTLYNFATALVYPSLSEGFGIPLLEAMACGTPIVASDIPVFREVAGDVPFYFNPQDPGELAEAIEGCRDRAVCQEHVARGLQQLDRYSWQKAAADTHAVYRKALG